MCFARSGSGLLPSESRFPLVVGPASEPPVCVGFCDLPILFGALQSGGLAMQSSEGIPASLSDIIQALILLGFSIRYAPQIKQLLRGVSRHLTFGRPRADA